MVGADPGQQRQLQGRVRRRGELAGPGEGLADRRDAVALRRDQGVPERDLEVQLQPAAVVVLGHPGQQTQGTLQVDHRLGHRRAAERGPPGLEPVGRRLVRKAGLREVVGEQLGPGSLSPPASALPAPGRCSRAAAGAGS